MANAKKRQERNRNGGNSGGNGGGGPGSLLTGVGGGAAHQNFMGTDTSDESERDDDDDHLNMQDLANLGWKKKKQFFYVINSTLKMVRYIVIYLNLNFFNEMVSTNNTLLLHFLLEQAQN